VDIPGEKRRNTTLLSAEKIEEGKVSKKGGWEWKGGSPRHERKEKEMFLRTLLRKGKKETSPPYLIKGTGSPASK